MHLLDDAAEPPLRLPELNLTSEPTFTLGLARQVAHEDTLPDNDWLASLVHHSLGAGGVNVLYVLVGVSQRTFREDRFFSLQAAATPRV